MIRFYNSWHRFKRKYPDKFFQVSYEQFLKTPITSFGELVEFAFDFEASSQIVKDALSYYDFKKQKSREHRFTEDETKHFHFKGKESYRDMMGEEIYGDICHKLRGSLTSTFGYSLAL